MRQGATAPGRMGTVPGLRGSHAPRAPAVGRCPPRGAVLPRWMHAPRTIRVGGVIRQWPPLRSRPRTRPGPCPGRGGRGPSSDRSSSSWPPSPSWPVPRARPTLPRDAPDRRSGDPAFAGASSAGGARHVRPARSEQLGAGHPPGGLRREADPFGVATFGLQTGTLPSFATDYFDKSDGWAGLDSRRQHQGLEPDALPPGDRCPHPPRRGHLGRGGHRHLRPVLHRSRADPRERQRGRRHLAVGVGVQHHLLPVVGGGSGRCRQLRGLLAPDRHHDAQPSRARSSSSCGTPTPRAPRPTAPDEAYPGRPLCRLRRDRRLDNFWGSPFAPSAAWHIN